MSECWPKPSSDALLAEHRGKRRVLCKPAELTARREDPFVAEAAAALRVLQEPGGAQQRGRATPRAWTCEACTFKHETPANMGFLTCEVCGTARDES